MFFFDNDNSFCINSMNNNEIKFCTEQSSITELFKNDQIFQDFEEANGKFLIYMKPTCPYCIKAMQLMDNNSFLYKKIDVNQFGEKYNIIKDKMNVRTVPQIFDIRDPKKIKYIGGCDNFIDFLNKK